MGMPRTCTTTAAFDGDERLLSRTPVALRHQPLSRNVTQEIDDPDVFEMEATGEQYGDD